jgi:hypothetical protein
VKVVIGAATENDAAAVHEGDGNIPSAIVAEVFNDGRPVTPASFEGEYQLA